MNQPDNPFQAPGQPEPRPQPTPYKPVVLKRKMDLPIFIILWAFIGIVGMLFVGPASLVIAIIVAVLVRNREE